MRFEFKVGQFVDLSAFTLKQTFFVQKQLKGCIERVIAQLKRLLNVLGRKAHIFEQVYVVGLSCVDDLRRSLLPADLWSNYEVCEPVRL
jgi:hypothetical protein